MIANMRIAKAGHCELAKPESQQQANQVDQNLPVTVVRSTLPCLHLYMKASPLPVVNILERLSGETALAA